MIRSLLLAATIILLSAGVVSAQDAYYDHNGSLMGLEWDDEGGDGFVVYYINPKASMRGVVEPGTVLFHGVSPANGSIYGHATVFSSKCGPSEYEVSGWFVDGSDDFNLEGAAPVLNTNTCQDVGLSWESPNAYLHFEYLHD